MGVVTVKRIIVSIIVLFAFSGLCFASEEITDSARDKAISEIGSLVNSQKYQSALIKCNNALKKYPDDAFLYYWKGTILSSLNDKKSALDNFDKSVELNPNNAKTYVMRGICKSDLGEKELALEDFNKAIELDSEDGSAYSMRACVKLELGDYSGADADLDTANKLMNSK